MKNQYKPNEVSHPGETMFDLLQEKPDLVSVLLEYLPRHIINLLIVGKMPITSPIARELAKVFGASADFWIERQHQYDVFLIKKQGELQAELNCEA